nr:hypothetical protein [Tanacetum cinerariifolium]
MKRSSCLILALLFAALRPADAVAQPMANATEAKKLPTVNLYVSDQKTTHLVFPQAVTYVDLGSSGIIAAKATGSENIVRVKAAGAGFGETNMTVLTAGGKLYTFVVNYQRSPKQLGLDLGANGEPGKLPITPLYVSDQKTTHLVFPYPVTYVDLGNPGLIASKATGAENIVRVKAAASTFPEANMTVLTSGGKLYMFLVNYQHDPKVLSLDMGAAGAAAGGGQATASTGGAILSNSPIPQGSLDTYSDKQVARRTAEQAIEVNPIYVYNGAQKKIDAKGRLQQVYIFKKFTIPDQKQLIIELYEKGGGRNIKLRLTNSDLLKARTFNHDGWDCAAVQPLAHALGLGWAGWPDEFGAPP